MREIFQVGVNCVYLDVLVFYCAFLYCAVQYTSKSLKNTVERVLYGLNKQIY